MITNFATEVTEENFSKVRQKAKIFRVLKRLHTQHWKTKIAGRCTQLSKLKLQYDAQGDYEICKLHHFLLKFPIRFTK